MQSLRRSVLPSARALSRPLRRVPRRHAHDSASSHPTANSDGKEHFGKGLFITLASVPIVMALWSLAAGARANPDGAGATPAFITRLINRYHESQKEAAVKSALKTSMMEQAAADRILMTDAERGSYVELRFPEIFNTGSPWNVPAGRGHGNIDAAIDKYHRQFKEVEEEKLRALREGTLKVVEAEQPKNQVYRQKKDSSGDNKS